MLATARVFENETTIEAGPTHMIFQARINLTEEFIVCQLMGHCCSNEGLLGGGQTFGTATKKTAKTKLTLPHHLRYVNRGFILFLKSISLD